MLIQKYLNPLYKRNKKIYKEFIKFLIKFNAYYRFMVGIGTRNEKGWNFMPEKERCKNDWEFFLITDAFPWEHGIWFMVDGEWKEFLREHDCFKKYRIIS